MKKNILLVLITAIICITGTVIASNYLASEVVYNNTTVDQALDELYNRTENYVELTSDTTVDPSTLLKGITAYNKNGELITGDVSTNCITGVLDTDDVTGSSTGKKISNFKPSYFIFLSMNTWYGMLVYKEEFSTTKMIAVDYNGQYNDVSRITNISDCFTLDDSGLYLKNYAASDHLYYMICK